MKLINKIYLKEGQTLIDSKGEEIISEKGDYIQFEESINSNPQLVSIYKKYLPSEIVGSMLFGLTNEDWSIIGDEASAMIRNLYNYILKQEQKYHYKK